MHFMSITPFKIKRQLGTSDARSQYRCGRVGRGIQPPFTTQTTPNTQTFTKSIKNARFVKSITASNGPMDQRMDGWTKPPIKLRIRN